MLQKYGGEEICKLSSLEETLVALRGSEHSLEQAAWDISGERQLEMLTSQLTATVDVITWL